MIFAFVIELFSTKIADEVDSRGVGTTRACADDEGGLIANRVDLAVYKPIFDLAESLVGLVIKQTKSVLIPTPAAINSKGVWQIKKRVISNLA